MNQVSDETLAELTRAIVREVDPEKVILFGSRARGDASPDSDLDLLVVKRESFGPGRSRWQEITRLWNLVIPFRLPVDLLLFSQEEVDNWRQSKNHVIYRALTEGRILYARP